LLCSAALASKDIEKDHRDTPKKQTTLKRKIDALDEENDPSKNKKTFLPAKEIKKKDKSLFFRLSLVLGKVTQYKFFPDEIVQNIAVFLTPPEIIRFSLTARHFFNAITQKSFDSQINKRNSLHLWLTREAVLEKIDEEDFKYNYPHKRLMTLYANYENAFADIRNIKLIFDEDFNDVKKLLLKRRPRLVSLLDLSSMGLKAVPSILKSFKNLTFFTVQSNDIAFLNLSHHPYLHYLSLNDNELEEIDLACQEYLIDLELNNNKLKQIDLSHNKKIRAVELNNNIIKEIDLSKNEKVELLYIDDNELTDLDLSHNKLLTELRAKNNNLQSINLKNNSKLSVIDLRGNLLNREEKKKIKERFPFALLD
jgi:hypothetical protein